MSSPLTALAPLDMSAFDGLDLSSNTSIEQPLAPARPNASPQMITPSGASSPGVMQQFEQAEQSFLNAGKQVLGYANPVNATTNIVAILLGLILVAGAVWSFSTIRDTAVNIYQRGKEAARTIAAAE